MADSNAKTVTNTVHLPYALRVRLKHLQAESGETFNEAIVRAVTRLVEAAERPNNNNCNNE